MDEADLVGLTDATGREETGKGVCWLLFLFWLVLTNELGLVLTLEVAAEMAGVPEDDDDDDGGALGAAEERAVVATGAPVVLCPFPF